METDSSGVIDLSLAINYLPACLTIFKTCILVLSLEIAIYFQNYGWLVAIGLILCFDRLTLDPGFFDANSILDVVFFAYCVLLLRSLPVHWVMPEQVWYVLSFAWVAYAIFAQAHHLASPSRVLVTFCFLSLVPYTTHYAWDVKAHTWIRSIFFMLLSLFWVYVIGVYKKKKPPPATAFVIYFSPVLFVPLLLAVAFSGSVLLLGLFHFTNWSALYHKKHDLETVPEEAPAALVIEETDQDLLLLFKQAKEQRGVRA